MENTMSTGKNHLPTADFQTYREGLPLKPAQSYVMECRVRGEITDFLAGITDEELKSRLKLPQHAPKQVISERVLLIGLKRLERINTLLQSGSPWEALTLLMKALKARNKIETTKADAKP